MTHQGDLFGAEPPRKPRKRPAYKETSREAYRSFTPISGQLDTDIMRVIRGAGPCGVICEHIERDIGRSHQAVSGNLRHLVERGHVKWNGEFGLTKSRRKARMGVVA